MKSIQIYKIENDWVAPDLSVIQAAIEKFVFYPLGATQRESVGFIPPRGEENGALIESVAGEWILDVKIEKKSVPASAINKRLKVRCEEIEKEFGRKPGKKEKKDLKAEIELDLLPMAFSKDSVTRIWFDRTNNYLIIGAGSISACDTIVTLILELFTAAKVSIGLGLLSTNTSPSAAMSTWLLTQEAPAGFSIDRECELKAADESKAIVRYARHALDIDEVRQHIEYGKLPTKLAMTWDDRISFILGADGGLKKIEFTDVVTKDVDEGGFDTDVAIMTGEFKKFIPDLVAALDGLPSM